MTGKLKKDHQKMKKAIQNYGGRERLAAIISKPDTARASSAITGMNASAVG